MRARSKKKETLENKTDTEEDEITTEEVKVAWGLSKAQIEAIINY